MVNKEFTNREVQLRRVIDFLSSHQSLFQADAGIIALRDQLLLEQSDLAKKHQRYIQMADKKGPQKKAHRKEYERCIRTFLSIMLRVTQEEGDGITTQRLLEINKSIRHANGNALLHLATELLNLAEVYPDSLAKLPLAASAQMELESYHDLFSHWAYGPSENIRERSGLRVEIAQLINKLKGLYRTQLSNMMVPYRYSHPDVFEEFRQASRLPKLGTRKASSDEMSLQQDALASDSAPKETKKAA